MTLLADATDFFCTEVLQDLYSPYDRMRDPAPVQRIGDSTFYAVCGWGAAIEAVARRRWSASGYQAFSSADSII